MTLKIARLVLFVVSLVLGAAADASQGARQVVVTLVRWPFT
jgi:hypothetical protein